MATELTDAGILQALLCKRYPESVKTSNLKFKLHQGVVTPIRPVETFATGIKIFD